MLDRFLAALHSRRRVRVSLAVPEEQSPVTFICAPLDYGEREPEDGPTFLFFDFDASEPFGVLPEWILDLEVLEEKFEPNQVIDWDLFEEPFIVPREW